MRELSVTETSYVVGGAICFCYNAARQVSGSQPAAANQNECESYCCVILQASTWYWREDMINRKTGKCNREKLSNSNNVRKINIGRLGEALGLGWEPDGAFYS